MFWRRWFGGKRDAPTSAGAADRVDTGARATPGPEPDGPAAAEHHALVQATANMTRDAAAQAQAQRHGLEILSLTWEDSARTKGSAYGPNISDMTIQVQSRPGAGAPRTTCMPVIRHPNFSDRSIDLPLDELFVLVGNERGAPLRRVGLRAYLGDLRAHLREPSSWPGTRRSLLTARDTHVLVSAQACFLPVPRRGLATFNPVLFNYPSSARNPAVLTVLVTREGTSATVIDNQRDGFGEGAARGQRLFFNQAGERASLTGQRVSDFVAAERPEQEPSRALAAARQQGLNVVLLVQVPLVHQAPRAFVTGSYPVTMCFAGDRGGASDVEDAVIGHGAGEGPFTEIDGLEIERDERFPIRVTVQFYKATSHGALDETDADAMAAQIERVYAVTGYAGSLVVEGETGRPTEWG